MRLNMIQRVILMVGFLLIAAHCLFPPRTRTPVGMGPPVSRAFLFSQDFYKTNIVERDTGDFGQAGGTFVTYNSVKLDTDRFWLIAVGLTAITLALTAVAGMLPSARAEHRR